MQGLYIWAKEILVYFYLYGNHSVVNAFNFFFPFSFITTLCSSSQYRVQYETNYNAFDVC